MPNLTITIPHQLGRAEARRRIDERASRLQSQHNGLLERVEQRWEGDTLHFLVGAVGQSVSGTLRVAEQDVHLEVALPWMLAMLAGVVKKQIEHHGRDLLGHHPSQGPR
ncbi:MAG TPA: polyhydroxyalkanoic acid system family protein [Gemmataceae bacterium]|jgi:putative polyhydroxyalkanoate system protein